MSMLFSGEELRFPVLNEAIYLERAQFGLGSFITLDSDQREDLLRILDLVIGYIQDKGRARPLNLYIEASPGSGKSFLVKQICKAAEELIGDDQITPLFFNATYFSNRDDLLHSFRKIQSSNIEHKLPIVFFDEMDSKLSNGEHTYKHFLAPMYDGKYFKDGHDWHTGNAIFFFAASKTINELVGVEKEHLKQSGQPGKENLLLAYSKWIDLRRDLYLKTLKPLLSKADKAPEKMKDFMDRVDEFIYLPPSNLPPDGDKTKGLMQAQYIAVSLLLARFPQVQYVESSVISLLALSIINSSSRRDAESCIFRSHPPRGIVLGLNNLPGGFIQENESVLKELEKPAYVVVGDRIPD
jgi:hypothetical protein